MFLQQASYTPPFGGLGVRIRTNFPGLETVLHEIPVAELAQAGNLEKLRDVFFAPERFRPDRSVEDVTRETAALFRDIVTEMEKHNEDPEKLARYLNQIVFCLYAEDAGLLPSGVFTQIVSQHFRNPETFNLAVTGLFNQMAKGGLFGAAEIAYFNGDLFNTVDTVELSGNALLLIAVTDRRSLQEELAEHRAVHLWHAVRAGAGRFQTFPTGRPLHQRRRHHAGGGAGGDGAPAPRVGGGTAGGGQPPGRGQRGRGPRAAGGVSTAVV